ncbi:MAG: hypothetical protein IH986_05405 [Planctomycetes bacterium]|nr:hypothetical protein [Planctomycetota bacterium]
MSPDTALILAIIDISRALDIVADAVLKGSAILLLAWVTSPLWKHAAAATRHMIWTAALLAILLTPVLRGVLPDYTVPLLPAPHELTAQSTTRTTPQRDALANSPPDSRESRPELRAGRIADTGGSLPNAQTPSDSPRTSAGRHERAFGWPRLALFVWCAGALLALARFAAARITTRRLIRHARPIVSPDWLRDLKDSSFRLGVRRTVRLLWNRAAMVPLTARTFRPVVLLPAQARDWPIGRRRAVLLHELAHVQRHDCFVQLPAQLACILLWFNPLVWMTARRARMERERACDDLVLAAGTRPSDYAGHLIEVARAFYDTPLQPAGVLAMARRGEVERRILYILEPCRNRGGSSRMMKMTAFLFTLAFVPPLAALQLWSAPTGVQPATLSLVANEAASVAAPEAPDERDDLIRKLQSDLADADRRARRALRAAEEAARRAEEETRRARHESEKVKQIKSIMEQMLASTDPVRSSDEPLDLFDRAAERVEEALGEHPAEAASLRNSIAQAYQQLGLHSDAQRALRALLTAQAVTLGSEASDLTKSAADLVRLNALQTSSEVALYLKALEQTRAKTSDASVRTQDALSRLANVLRITRDDAESDGVTSAALKNYRELLSRAHPTSIETLRRLGLWQRDKGQLAQAEKALRAALKLQRRASDVVDSETLTNLNLLGLLLKNQGRPAEARDRLAEALNQAIASHPEEHPLIRDLQKLLEKYAESETERP